MTGAIATPEPLPVVRPSEMKIVPAEHRWMIDTLWSSQAVGWIAGTPKAGKSWLGLEMAISVATGSPCLDRFAVRQRGRALIYLAEDALPNIRERLEALCLYKGLRLDELDLRVIDVPSLRLDRHADLQRLEATLAAHRPRLLLLDPLVRLHRSDENNAQDVASILADLRDLQRRYELAIIVVHHTRKASGGQVGQSLRGSGDLHAWSDSALYLLQRTDHVELIIEHRSAPRPDPLALRLKSPPAHLEVVEMGDEPAAVPLDQRVLDILRNAAGPQRRQDIRASLAVNNQRLGDALCYLEKLERVERTPLGWLLA
jgi:RecA-family ATPase